MGARPEPAPRTAGEMLRRGRAFLEAKRVPEARLSAELLVAHALGLDRLGLFLQLDRPVDEGEVGRARASLVRRAKREPVAHITGHREFYGRSFELTPDVLLPRPETELLVDLARERAGARRSRRRTEAEAPPETARETPPEPVSSVEPAGLEVGDFGTGSGCLAVTLALELPGARVHAVDVSAPALAVARANAERLGARVRFVEGDRPGALLEGAGAPEALDLLLANPPYVDPAAAASLEPEVRDFEPAGALFTPAGDPGYWLRRLLDEGPRLLRAGGVLLVELGFDQEALARELARERGFDPDVHRDLDGNPRVLEVALPRDGRGGSDLPSPGPAAFGGGRERSGT